MTTNSLNIIHIIINLFFMFNLILKLKKILINLSKKLNYFFFLIKFYKITMRFKMY